jgi:4-alpha-glucanotransferase
MYVVQYELSPDPQRALRPVPVDVVAGLNTHDMSTFAAFWQGQDIEDRLKMGLFAATDAQAEWRNRDILKQALVSFLQREAWHVEGSFDPWAVLKAILAFLSASSARMILVNLEDLWLETEPQNVPGTQEPYPNWRRKARHNFETFSQLPQVTDVLNEMDRLRKQGVYK